MKSAFVAVALAIASSGIELPAKPASFYEKSTATRNDKQVGDNKNGIEEIQPPQTFKFDENGAMTINRQALIQNGGALMPSDISSVYDGLRTMVFNCIVGENASVEVVQIQHDKTGSIIGSMIVECGDGSAWDNCQLYGGSTHVEVGAKCVDFKEGSSDLEHLTSFEFYIAKSAESESARFSFDGMTAGGKEETIINSLPMNMGNPSDKINANVAPLVATVLTNARLIDDFYRKVLEEQIPVKYKFLDAGK